MFLNSNLAFTDTLSTCGILFAHPEVFIATVGNKKRHLHFILHHTHYSGYHLIEVQYFINFPAVWRKWILTKKYCRILDAAVRFFRIYLTLILSLLSCCFYIKSLKLVLFVSRLKVAAVVTGNEQNGVLRQMKAFQRVVWPGGGFQRIGPQPPHSDSICVKKSCLAFKYLRCLSICCPCSVQLET